MEDIKIDAEEKEIDTAQKRAMGCVLGAFVGDAAGAVLEFIGHKNINETSVAEAMKMPGGGVFKVGPGQITDDSEMAMCLLHAAYDDHEHLNLDKIAENFGKWY